LGGGCGKRREDDTRRRLTQGNTPGGAEGSKEKFQTSEGERGAEL